MSTKKSPSNTEGFHLFSQNFTFTAWKDFTKQLLYQIHNDNVVIVSAGVGFFFFLALFPAMAGLISIYSLAADPAQIQDQLGQLASMLPKEASGLLTERLSNFLRDESGKGWQLLSSIVLSIWVANIGTRALFKGINIAYNTDARRKFVKENAITLLYTTAGIILNLVLIVIMVGLPVVAEKLGLESFFKLLANWLQWPVFATVIALALGLVYRYAPYKREMPGFGNTMRGASIAAALWIVGSWLLSFLLRTVGIFSEPYGSSLAIVFMMLWCLLISFIVLLGAEINSVLEAKRLNENPSED
jgi:membrane protein